MKQFFVKKFISEYVRDNGGTEYEASQTEGAAEANAKDQQVENNRLMACTKADFLKAAGFTAFPDRESMMLALKDELYSQSPAYREAVQELIAGTNTDFNVASGESTQDTLTDESMLEVAAEDARRASAKKVFADATRDPVSRFELMQAIASEDPATLAVIDQVVQDNSNEGPLQRAFRTAKRGTYGPDLSKAQSTEEDDNGMSDANGPAREGEAKGNA